MLKREKKWTRGEWRVELGDLGRAKVISLFEGEVEEIAEADTWLGDQKANAHLMSAAPDLVDALEALLSEVETSSLYDDTDVYAKTIRARAAIAKAYGEAG